MNIFSKVTSWFLSRYRCITLRTLGSGSTIFFEALAAGVFLDFSMAIRYETSASTASRSAIVTEEGQWPPCCWLTVKESGSGDEQKEVHFSENITRVCFFLPSLTGFVRLAHSLNTRSRQTQTNHLFPPSAPVSQTHIASALYLLPSQSPFPPFISSSFPPSIVLPVSISMTIKQVLNTWMVTIDGTWTEFTILGSDESNSVSELTDGRNRKTIQFMSVCRHL